MLRLEMEERKNIEPLLHMYIYGTRDERDDVKEK
jgi:hypothetical protein